MRQWTRSTNVRGVAAILLTVSGVGLVLFSGCHQKAVVQTAVISRRPLTVPILADGSLEPPPGGEIRSTVGGTVRTLFVHEGARVARGTPLLLLENTDLAQRTFGARAEALAIDGERNRLQGDLAAQRLERERLRKVIDSDKRLAAAGAITARQREDDELAYREADQRVTQLSSQTESLAARSRITSDSAYALETQMNQLTVRAPVEGIVYNLPRVAGESVSPGQQLGNVADPRHLRVRVRIDSPDLPRIHSGLRMIVTFDGLPNRRWNGTVVLVPPGLREVGGREVAEILGELADDSAALPAKASVNVEIVVGEKLSALVAPRGGVFREGSTRFVFRLVDGRAVRTKIVAGLIGPNEIEIASGLKEGDEVILPGSVPLRDGAAVERGAQP